MDRKFKKDSGNIFKREGFYIVLFVCLCIIATVAVITSRRNNSEDFGQLAQNDTNVEEAIDNIEPSLEVDNALEVQNNLGESEIRIPKKVQPKTTTVSSSNTIKLIDPVDGTLARAFSEFPVYYKSNDQCRPCFGVDIKSELGASVKASYDGTVEKICFDNDGWKVIIKHSNALRTVYANLDEKIEVKEGDKVKKGDEIGKVGNTTLNAAYEDYGDHLYFQVLKGEEKEPVDPNKYIQFKKAS